MAESPRERLEAWAGIVFALVPCPVCMEGQISARDPEKDAVALKTASDDWDRGNYPNLSKSDVLEMMNAVLAEAKLGCRECVSDVHDKYELRTMLISNKDLDQAAKLIYNRIEKRDIAEIYEYIAALKVDFPDDKRIRLLELSIDSVLYEYKNAYQDEVAARRAAPIWHTREREQERQEVQSANAQIEKLQQQLDESRSPEFKYQGEWERYQSDYRVIRLAQDRLRALERKSELLSRGLIFSSIAFCVALCGDVWAVLEPGGLYREAGKFVIGVSGLVTLIGPFIFSQSLGKAALPALIWTDMDRA